MAEPEETTGPPPGGEAPPEGTPPTEEELRAQYEEQIRRVRVQDLILQSVVSILQLSARRIAKDDERDLEQARVGIDAADAMIDHVPEEAQDELRQAVSELKMLFAQHSAGGGEDPSGDGSPGETESPPKPPPAAGQGDSGLWTPGS